MSQFLASGGQSIALPASDKALLTQSLCHLAFFFLEDGFSHHLLYNGKIGRAHV